MSTLLHRGPMCQRDIGPKILKSSGDITTVIDNREKMGRRSSTEDRRYSGVHLTEDGRELIGRIFPGHVEGIVKSFHVIPAEERKELAASSAWGSPDRKPFG